MAKKKKRQPRTKTLPPIHANRGVEAKYRKRLTDMLNDMHEDMQQVTRQGQSLMAQDTTPQQHIRKSIADTARKWQNRYYKMAQAIAAMWANSAFSATDRAFNKALKDSGWAIKPKKSQAIQNALDLAIVENVNLIRTIPQQYFGNVEKIVRINFDKGRDMYSMRRQLTALYPQARRRMSLIARDQTKKANSTAVKISLLESKFVDAIWQHSHAGKVPRPDHLAADGKTFKIADGMKLKDGWVQPGQLINCRCTCRPVIPLLKD